MVSTIRLITAVIVILIAGTMVDVNVLDPNNWLPVKIGEVDEDAKDLPGINPFGLFVLFVFVWTMVKPFDGFMNQWSYEGSEEEIKEEKKMKTVNEDNFYEIINKLPDNPDEEFLQSFFETVSDEEKFQRLVYDKVKGNIDKSNKALNYKDWVVKVGLVDRNHVYDFDTPTEMDNFVDGFLMEMEKDLFVAIPGTIINKRNLVYLKYGKKGEVL